MRLRGQQAGDNSIVLETTISPDLDRALTQLVALSGVSKATLVRHSLHWFLSALGAVYPELNDSLSPTRIAGRSSRAPIRSRSTK